MSQQGLGYCQPIDQRNHVWIGVVITLISSTVLNLGLNGQKYALRKHDERRVHKEMEMEEEHERWRQQLGWTEEQVEQEAERLFEIKENRRGPLYRKLKPYMFWRAIFVSKVQSFCCVMDVLSPGKWLFFGRQELLTQGFISIFFTCVYSHSCGLQDWSSSLSATWEDSLLFDSHLSH